MGQRLALGFLVLPPIPKRKHHYRSGERDRIRFVDKPDQRHDGMGTTAARPLHTSVVGEPSSDLD